MSLDVYLRRVQPSVVFTANITHNLGDMAEEAGIYWHLWRPEEIGITKADELIKPLQDALTLMYRDPERFRKHNAPDGWTGGMYEHFVAFVEEYVKACQMYPEAEVTASR